MGETTNGCIANIIVCSVNVVRHVNAPVLIHRRLRILADGIASDEDTLPCSTRVGHVEDVVVDHIRIDHVWVVAFIEHDVDVIHTPSARTVRIKRGLNPRTRAVGHVCNLRTVGFVGHVKMVV